MSHWVATVTGHFLDANMKFRKQNQTYFAEDVYQTGACTAWLVFSCHKKGAQGRREARGGGKKVKG